MQDSRSAKKKELYKLAVARTDITSAMDTCNLIIENVGHIGDDFYLPLFHAIVIAYARPFTRNRPLGRLSAEWSTFSTPDFQETHDDLIRSRDKFIAHSDEEVRRVEIYPPGAPLGETGYLSGSVGVAVRTIAFPLSRFHDIRVLCSDLGHRLESRINILLAELYNSRELPNESFTLTFDDNL
jgi:hypothetical protein